MVQVRYALTKLVLVTVTAAVMVQPILAQQADRQTRFDRAPLLKEPTTPEEMFAATILMVDLIRNDLAAQYLEQFEAAAPDDETMIRLRDKHGMGEFLKLAQTKELQPRSLKILQRMNAVSKKQAENPVFVDALLQRVIQGGLQREAATAELRNAGVQVVPEILKQMQTPELAPHQDLLVTTLIKMGNQVIPPLIGALESPYEPLRAATIDALGWLDAKQAIPYLWFLAFDENQPAGIQTIARKTLAKLLKGSELQFNELSSVEASNELRRLAKLYYKTSDALPVNDDGHVSLWSWDDTAGTVATQTLTPDLAALTLSTRFARQALVLSPDQPEPQRQYLASLLGLETLQNGWDRPRVAAPGSAMYLATLAGEDIMSQVLTEALEAGQSTTAVPALEVLSLIGTRAQLVPRSGLKSPVVAALNSPDQRVQFAAATTILKLDPTTPFSGATRVVEVLARATTDPRQGRALVIDADKNRGTVTSGYLFDGGYEGIFTLTGREGFEKAASLAGINVIIVHVNCARWELSQTLANLRADARTAAIPIAIYGPSKLDRELTRLVNRSQPAIYITESPTADDFLAQLRPFVRSQQTPAPSDLERSLQKNAAVYWLSMIGTTNLAKVFDISLATNELSTVVDDPHVAVNGLIALGSITTGAAQRRLANVAMNPQAGEIIRETAASQLALHIQQHGLLLSREEVAELETTWKQTDNARVKAALASVIGSLRPNAATIGERLKNFQAPKVN